MKSFKMKALSLAVLGLVGVGMASSASATCPTATIAANGNVTLAPWSGGKVAPTTAQGNGASAATLAVTSVGGGLGGTSCKLALALGSNGLASPAPGNARVSVNFADNGDEPRFRGRFYIDTTNVTNINSGANVQAETLELTTATSPVGQSTQVVTISLAGGAQPRFNFVVLDGSGVAKQSGNVVTAGYGVNIVEFDLQRGDGTACAANASANNFRYWVTDSSGINVAASSQNAGVAADDTHPSGTLCVNTSGWTGAPTVVLGIPSSSGRFRQVASTNADTSAFNLFVDEFDSRRATFIGKN